jgi:hypothetical protein
VRYAIRLPANHVLERQIEDLLTRPRGRPSYAPLVRYRSFHYQATSWDRPRRVIAKVEHHLGELFPRVGFIVTTLSGTNRAVVRFYNLRGTAEQWIKEGKTATHWTRLSCHRFRANEVRFLLGVIAYNLGNLLRRLVLPVAIQTWSLTSLQQRLFKTGGRLIRQGTSLKDQLVGTWIYVSSTAKRDDGSNVPRPSLQGAVTYTGDGRFHFITTRTDAPKYASGDLARPSPDEAMAIASGSIAYTGTYTVDENSKTIHVSIETSTFPNLVRAPNQRRIITPITADEMKFTNPRTLAGLTLEIVWKRAK